MLSQSLLNKKLDIASLGELAKHDKQTRGVFFLNFYCINIYSFKLQRIGVSDALVSQALRSLNREEPLLFFFFLHIVSNPLKYLNSYRSHEQMLSPIKSLSMNHQLDAFTQHH